MFGYIYMFTNRENGEKMIWMFYEDYLKRMA